MQLLNMQHLKPYHSNVYLLPEEPQHSLYVHIVDVAGSTFCTTCFFSSLSALGPIHLFLTKDGWCLDTLWIYVMHVLDLIMDYVSQAQNKVVRYKSKTCIIWPKVCMGSTKMCPGNTRHILDGQKGKKEAANTFFCITCKNRRQNNVHI
jgi:hypothetical protein